MKKKDFLPSSRTPLQQKKKGVVRPSSRRRKDLFVLPEQKRMKLFASFDEQEGSSLPPLRERKTTVLRPSSQPPSRKREKKKFCRPSREKEKYKGPPLLQERASRRPFLEREEKTSSATRGGKSQLCALQKEGQFCSLQGGEKDTVLRVKDTVLCLPRKKTVFCALQTHCVLRPHTRGKNSVFCGLRREGKKTQERREKTQCSAPHSFLV